MKTPPKWLTTGYMVLFAVLPWSFQIGFGTWQISLPSEPLIGCLSLGLAYCVWLKPLVFKGIFFNNVFLQISFAYLVWMAVSACFSSLPMVSWKYWLVTAGHWWVFAAGISVWPGLWRRAFPWFAFSMVGVAVYTIVHHGFYHFRADQAMLAPMPFFPDHTMWAAAVTMVLFLELSGAMTLGHRLAFHRIALLLLFAALVLSTCRAAWVSFLLAGIVWCFFVLGKRCRVALMIMLLLAGAMAFPKITQSLNRDVSSQERINRWHCAFRMAHEKPLIGFGPGTFQFQYLDFQKPEEMTRISLRKPSDEHNLQIYGRGGGAHSEYLRAWAETGWSGLLLWLGLLMLVPATFVTGLPGKKHKISIGAYGQVNAALLALLTFFAHSAVNDFLHDGRIAALVWGSMAILFAEEKLNRKTAKPENRKM